MFILHSIKLQFIGHCFQNKTDNRCFTLALKNIQIRYGSPPNRTVINIVGFVHGASVSVVADLRFSSFKLARIRYASKIDAGNRK